MEDGWEIFTEIVWSCILHLGYVLRVLEEQQNQGQKDNVCILLLKANK